MHLLDILVAELIYINSGLRRHLVDESQLTNPHMPFTFERLPTRPKFIGLWNTHSKSVTPNRLGIQLRVYNIASPQRNLSSAQIENC